MMKKSERLKTIVDLNAAQEKKALEAFGQVQKKQVQLQMQLDHLVKYRKEYQEKFDDFCGAGARVGQLLEFKSFLDKLDKAISGQEQALRALDTELSRVRSNWVGLHNRTKNLSKLCDAAHASEIKQQDRREQTAQDDRVAAGRRGGTKNAD